MSDTVYVLWQDNMLMGTTSINQLLSCILTKRKLSYHLAYVLEHFEGNAVNVMVVCDADYLPTEAHKGTLSRGGWCTHSTACPSEHSRERLTGGVCLVSWQTNLRTNTNVLILLMDLKSHDYLSAMTMLILLTHCDILTSYMATGI